MYELNKTERNKHLKKFLQRVSENEDITEICDDIEKNDYLNIARSAIDEDYATGFKVMNYMGGSDLLTTDPRLTTKGYDFLEPEVGVDEFVGRESGSVDTNQVFIVHGRNNESKEVVARFIEKLGLKSIILHEQISSGLTIIEKIEKYTNVGYAVAIYTPCDIGRFNSEGEVDEARARQNVVFEHGYLVGKLGRSNVCALIKGKVETPNDISGMVYTNMDDAGAWKFELAKELKLSGYEIDMNDVI